MQLYDKDLLSVQEVRELVQRAKHAQQQLATKSQDDIDEIIRAIADAGVRNAVRLGRMAQEETGFGIAEDKAVKNIFGSRVVYDYVRDMKTVGVLEHDEVNKTFTVGVPMGVIAGLIPSTNPTSTVFYKSIISIKAGNSIVFSPHPNAKNCILAAVSVIRQAIAEAGANEDLVNCVTIPTVQATNTLMSHRDTALILATGG
ncbi:MAG TPA: aldehyde dehydrogenase family protein, partial [Bacillota bacterium]|nr:aldehyde dehydrogenase family protein [Bacillota bacterium]